jgi:MFS family permease
MPQGIGAALTMTVTGRLVDRGFGRALVFTGLPVMAAGFVAFTQAGAGNVVTSASMFVLGIGTGAVIAPLMQAAYAAVDRADIPRATSTLNILQRMGGAVGTAVIAVLLQHNLAHAGAGGAEGAFNATFLLPLVVAAAAVLPTLLLPRSKPRPVPEQPERREPAKVA